MTTANTPATPPDYRDMINTERVRSSLRRLFGGTIDEVLGELLQNAQRANARHVGITTSAEGWTFADDGDGLPLGLDGFWTLLRIAESAYCNPTIEAQDPMGLGIHALLAHRQVSEVTFTSGDYTLTIDTARWWDDQAYYRSWSERVARTPEPVRGLQIDVRCDARLVEQVRGAAIAVDYERYFGRKWSPFQGYDDLLDVTLDGQAVRTTAPRHALPSTVLIRTTYLGAELVIGGHWSSDPSCLEYSGGRGTLNWYGQLVPVRGLSAWSYYLKVRQGRPLNPKSPSRQGVIEDAALEALEAFIRDRIFSTLCDPQQRDRLTPGIIKAAYALDPKRAEAKLPYLVVAPYAGPDGSQSSIDGLQQFGEERVVTYTEAPLLLREGVRYDLRTQVPFGPVAGDRDYITAEYGIDSFVPVLKAAGLEPHRLVVGNAARVTQHDLYWTQGAPRADAFNEPGQWGLSASGDAPESWSDIASVETVFAFCDTSSYDATAVDWAVGTTNPQGFLQDAVWYGFSPHDDEDYDPQEHAYRESVDAWLRSVIGDCVPHHFDYWQVQRQMPTPGSPIVSIRYVLPRRKRDVPPAVDHRRPTAIIARNALGETKRLLLVA